jgi:hypothetical protein
VRRCVTLGDVSWYLNDVNRRWTISCRTPHIIIVKIPEGKYHLEEVGINCRIILKHSVKVYDE